MPSLGIWHTIRGGPEGRRVREGGLGSVFHMWISNYLQVISGLGGNREIGQSWFLPALIGVPLYKTPVKKRGEPRPLVSRHVDRPYTEPQGVSIPHATVSID